MSFLYGQLIIGPAGSGKSTYCHAIQEMAEILKRNVICVNLDPAAESFKYRCDVDIRDLITLDDVMEELCLGPNGGLVYCMEYMIENIDWVQEQIGDLGNDDYVLFDLPGQIELYTHLELMQKFIKTLQNAGFNVCSMYMLDVTFLSDNNKFVSGVLTALSAMMQMNLPHLTVLTKCDLIKDKHVIDNYLDYAENIELLPESKDLQLGNTPDNSDVDSDEEEVKRVLKERKEQRKLEKKQNKINNEEEEKSEEEEEEEDEKLTIQEKQEIILAKKNKKYNDLSAFDKKYNHLNNMMKDTISEFSMVSIRPLDISNDDTIKALLTEADTLIQFGENLEPDEKAYREAEEYLNGYYQGDDSQMNDEQYYN